jgi:hypothetical protein
MRQLLIGVLLTCSLGCVNRYTVTRQATPNPISAQTRLLVEPMRFEALTIDGLPEADWRARRTPQQNLSFDGDKRLLNARFGQRLDARARKDGIALTAAVDADTIVLRPILRSLTMGYYGFVVGDDTIADMTVQLLDAQGQLLDEIAVHTAGKADESGISFTDRLAKAADKAADQCVKYLVSRRG